MNLNAPLALLRRTADRFLVDGHLVTGAYDRGSCVDAKAVVNLRLVHHDQADGHAGLVNHRFIGDLIGRLPVRDGCIVLPADNPLRV